VGSGFIKEIGDQLRLYVDGAGGSLEDLYFALFG